MGGAASTQADVYSYGVLLLETFTGKRPTNEMFHSDLDLRRYVAMAYPDSVLDIVDPSMMVNLKSETAGQGRIRDSFVSILRLGLSCSQESPSKRMEMGDVINELLLVKKLFDG